MFMSEYSHTIDAKGRLIIPSRYREELGDTFVVTKGLDGCLFAYTQEAWKHFEEKLRTIPLSNAKGRRFARYFLAGATLCEVDKQGRILIPANLRAAAGLEKDVVLAGVGERVEIWDRSRWIQANTYDDMDEVADNMEGLGI